MNILKVNYELRSARSENSTCATEANLMKINDISPVATAGPQ